MNERDKELAEEAEAYADRDFKGEINWSETYESKLISLIRADERGALEALEDRTSLMKWQIARDAIKEALAQPDQKPMVYESSIGYMFGDKR